MRFGNGKDIIDPKEANFDGRSESKESYSRVGKYRESTTPVGSFPPNALGLYDMSGNVWEWVSDWYSIDYYKNSPKNNPQGPETGSSRVIRGGSWNSFPRSLRCADRRRDEPGYRNFGLGFRLSRTF